MSPGLLLHCRSLGDALRQWQANLSVTSDSAKPEEAANPEEGADPSGDPQQLAADPSKGEFEFMGANEGMAEGETQTLAPATEEQAKALDPTDHPALPDQDTNDVMAAVEQEVDEPMTDASHHTGPDQVLKGNAAGSQAAAGIQEEAATDEIVATDAHAQAAEDVDMTAIDVARDPGDDSYVSTQLQRASLAEGGVGDLPDEDMVLAEGGLSHGAAEQLRRDVEMRIKAASEGTLQLDTSAKAASYGQEVSKTPDVSMACAAVTAHAMLKLPSCHKKAFATCCCMPI